MAALGTALHDATAGPAAPAIPGAPVATSPAMKSAAENLTTRIVAPFAVRAPVRAPGYWTPRWETRWHGAYGWLTVTEKTRPGPLRWLRYAFGGRLPPPLHEWVLHDLTDADWRLRELFRVCVQVAAPVVLAILFLPGPLEVRVLTAALLACGALFVGAAYGEELRNRRLRQHGLRHRR